jgi:hypothetical protein
MEDYEFLNKDFSDIKTKLQAEALNARREEYKELNDIWRTLETKAQANVTISGLFIGSIFAMVKDNIAVDNCMQIFFLCITILALLSSVIFSILVLKIRTVNLPTFGNRTQEIVSTLVTNSKGLDNISKSWFSFLEQQATFWKEVNDDYKEKNEDKAAYVYWAQVSLGIAILAIAAVILIKII